MSFASSRHTVSRPRKAFTLVELLVVIGIIALLISILLPSLSKARKAGNTVKSLANLKQIMTATIMYAGDNHGYLPYTGWGDFPKTTYKTAGIPGSKGFPDWLYDSQSCSTTNFTVTDLKGGALYPYLNTPEVYRCPEDLGPWIPVQSQNICSYVANGCMNDLADPSTSNAGMYKLSSFKGSNAMFWEIGYLTTASNDPANYPYEAISAHHNKGSVIAFIDGHADVWPHEKFDEQSSMGPSDLFCCPENLLSPPSTNNGRGGWDGAAHIVPYSN